jgi:hypothetical protein
MDRDSKSQLTLWDVENLNYSSKFYEWLVSHQRDEVIALLQAPGPELWHPFIVKLVLCVWLCIVVVT